MRLTASARSWTTRFLVVVLAGVALAACLPESEPDPTVPPPSPPGLEATATPAEIATEVLVTQAPILEATAGSATAETLPTQEPATPTHEARVAPSTEGPWLLFSNLEGIWIINPDGTGLSQLGDPGEVGFFELRDGLSPGGRHLAYLSSENTYHRLTLHIVSLPDGQVEATIPLTSPATEPAVDAMQGDPLLEAVRPIVEAPSLAWSPDGSRLAFVGVFDGPSSDLYTYQVEDDRVVRLTDGPNQAIRPRWSPDGQEIVHLAVAGMGTGAGFGVLGVWAAAVDGSGARLLYEPGSGDEIPIGWIDSARFVVYSWQVRCGRERLRVVDRNTLKLQDQWPGAFSHVAMDPETGALLLAVDPLVAQCDVDGQAGVFLLEPDGGPAWRIVEDDVNQLAWSPEAGLFLGATEHGVLAVSRSGDFIDLSVPAGASGLPLVAPNTRDLAWTGSGLWLGALTSSLEQPPRELFSERVGQAAWGSEGQRLMFFSGGALYVADSPDFEPKRVAEGMSAGALIWVQPQLAPADSG